MADTAADTSPRRAEFDWPLVLRIFLATVGSYAMSASVAMGLARALAVSEVMMRSEATAAATLIGMLLWPCSVIYVFGASSAARAASLMTGTTLTGAVVAWIAGQPL